MGNSFLKDRMILDEKRFRVRNYREGVLSVVCFQGQWCLLSGASSPGSVCSEAGQRRNVAELPRSPPAHAQCRHEPLLPNPKTSTHVLAEVSHLSLDKELPRRSAN